MDRVALKYVINPLDESETRKMIEFRLKQAGFQNQNPLFTDEAIKLIYGHTQGYPRKISMMCHDALETAVMKDKSFIDAEIISGLIFHGAQT